MAVMAADPKGVSTTPSLSRVMPSRRRDSSKLCRRELPSSWQKRRQASTLPGLMGLDITTPDISEPPSCGPASSATELSSHRQRAGVSPRAQAIDRAAGPTRCRLRLPPVPYPRGLNRLKSEKLDLYCALPLA